MGDTGTTKSCFNFLILKVLMGWGLCLPSFTTSQVTCRDDEEPFPHRLHEFCCHLKYCSFGYHQSCGTSTDLKVKHRIFVWLKRCQNTCPQMPSGTVEISLTKRASNQMDNRGGKKPSHNSIYCLLLFLKIPCFNLPL